MADGPSHETALLSEASLAVDWLKPEEDVLVPKRKFVIADNGLPYFPPSGRKLTPEMIKAAQDDDVD